MWISRLRTAVSMLTSTMILSRCERMLWELGTRSFCRKVTSNPYLVHLSTSREVDTTQGNTLTMSATTTLPAVEIWVSSTYLPCGLESGQYAVVIDVGHTRHHYQPKGLISYPRETAEFFAADLRRIFAGACEPLKIMANSSYFRRVA